MALRGEEEEIVDSDENYVDDENPLFGRINGAPRCLIPLHVTPTKKMRKNMDGTDTQYLFQGKCKLFQKNMSVQY